MTLLELVLDVDAERYTTNTLFQELRTTTPEYGYNRRIIVKRKNGGISVTNVHVGALGDILTFPIDVEEGLELTREQLLDAILHEMSSNGIDEAEQIDFWNEMTNLQKAKILR